MIDNIDEKQDSSNNNVKNKQQLFFGINLWKQAKSLVEKTSHFI